MPEFVNWQDIAGDFTGTLILGNGASMAVDPRFSYRSLLQTARDAGLITESIQRVFAYLETNDFELVMSLIWNAYHVNQALGIPDDQTRQAYEDVRAALVESVQRTHSDYDVVRPHLRPIYEFMRRHDEVLSLNYDLIVYWAMLEGNTEYGNWFKDCFVNGEFDSDWERFYDPYRADGSTLVFYPHGNLALTSDLLGDDWKVVREGPFDNLLQRILEEWRSGRKFPLFVSEGDNRQKERAILRSAYLSTVYNSVLPEMGPKFTIYGWSLSENDDHILKKICKRDDAHLAISVYRGDRTVRQLQDDCTLLELRIRAINRNVRVVFFPADSEGCWNVPSSP